MQRQQWMQMICASLNPAGTRLPRRVQWVQPADGKTAGLYTITLLHYLDLILWTIWTECSGQDDIKYRRFFCGFPPIGSSRESRYEQVLWSWLGCRFHPQSQRALLRWVSMLASSVCVGFIQEAQNVMQTSVWPCWIFCSIYSSCTHIVHVVWFEAVWMAPQVLLLSVSHLFLSPPPLFFMSKLGKTENYTQIAGTNCSL